MRGACGPPNWFGLKNMGGWGGADSETGPDWSGELDIAAVS